MKNYFRLIVLLTLILAGCAPKTEHNRKFIAHMGYSCRRTIAGENSLEAIRYAARAGFQTIELDVCLSKDSIPMAIHGYALRPWLLDKDGNKVDHALRVKDFTAKELKEDFIVRTDNPEARTQIATLEEHLKLCKELGLLPFIEPKEYDATGRHYLDLMECADSIMGRGNYIITSNNVANRVIRDTLGVDDVKLMGILYQTTWEDIVQKGDIVMAICSKRYDNEAFAENVAKAKAAGLETESHADTFDRFDKINNADIDYVSTDLIAPDWYGQGKTVKLIRGRGERGLRKALRMCSEMPALQFGAIYLEMEFKGSAKVTLSDMEFEIAADAMRPMQYQLILPEKLPVFNVTESSDDFEVGRISVRIVEF